MSRVSSVSTVLYCTCMWFDNWIHSSLENSASVFPNLVETLSSILCTSCTTADIFCCWSAWYMFSCWRSSLISCCCDLTKRRSSPSDDKTLPSCKIQSRFRLLKNHFLFFQLGKQYTTTLNECILKQNARRFQLDQCTVRMINCVHCRDLQWASIFSFQPAQKTSPQQSWFFYF